MFKKAVSGLAMSALVVSSSAWAMSSSEAACRASADAKAAEVERDAKIAAEAAKVACGLIPTSTPAGIVAYAACNIATYAIEAEAKAAGQMVGSIYFGMCMASAYRS